ncbi:hypothetical protein Taro_025845 [Colocasia esculenta]|uniref:Uncharacterized protein n=1 Tax=Colocasia esculenta TaxID=4460 RepID=A0A843VLQ8_COLES|nr:hypothetical protein [Colocasia esculenta]
MVGCSWETRVAVLGRVIAELSYMSTASIHLSTSTMFPEPRNTKLIVSTDSLDLSTDGVHLSTDDSCLSIASTYLSAGSVRSVSRALDPHSRTQKTPLYVPVDSPIILLSTDSYRTSILSLENSPCRQQASACRQVPTIL